MTTFQVLLYQICGRGGNAMLKSYEILGTDKPIFKEKQSDHFSLFEIVHLNENPENYQVDGYVQVIENEQVFFEPVYIRYKDNS